MNTAAGGRDASPGGEAAKPAQPRAGQLLLVRHGLPNVDRSVKLDWRAFRLWWQGYDAAGLAPGQTPPAELCAAAEQADVIFCSTLPRAIATAEAIANGRPLMKDPIFVEAPLPPPRWPGRRSPRRWGIVSRITWWFGDHQDMESRQAAELRAEAAAATLTARALRGETVMLVAHGWFNRMMRPVLLKHGWRCVRDGGDDYWSFRRYMR